MDNPWWYLVGGVIVAVVGAAMAVYAETDFWWLVGVVAVGAGWVGVQFAIVAAGAEYALRRVREDIDG